MFKRPNFSSTTKKNRLSILQTSIIKNQAFFSINCCLSAPNQVYYFSQQNCFVDENILKLVFIVIAILKLSKFLAALKAAEMVLVNPLDDEVMETTLESLQTVTTGVIVKGKQEGLAVCKNIERPIRWRGWTRKEICVAHLDVTMSVQCQASYRALIT